MTYADGTLSRRSVSQAALAACLLLACSRAPSPAVPARPAAAQPPASASNAPPPELTRVGVVSEPTGARITLDGRIVGVTPMSRLLVEPGEHMIVIELAGYEANIQRFTAVAKDQVAIAAALHEARAQTSSPPAAPAAREPDDSYSGYDCAANQPSCRHECWAEQQRCKMECPECSLGCDQGRRSCERQCERCR